MCSYHELFLSRLSFAPGIQTMALEASGQSRHVFYAHKGLHYGHRLTNTSCGMWCRALCPQKRNENLIRQGGDL